MTFHSLFPTGTVLPIYFRALHEIRYSELKFSEHLCPCILYFEWISSVWALEFPFRGTPINLKLPELVTLGALFLFALVELFIAVWLTAKYNANDNFPTSETPSRVRYLLFMSIWIIVFGIVYLVGFFVAENSILASVGSSFVLYVLSHSIRHLISQSGFLLPTKLPFIYYL